MNNTTLELLPKDGDTETWSPQEKALMEACGLAGTKNVQRGGKWTKEAFQADRATVEAFLFQCRRTGLDPIARQIYCIQRGGKWGIQLSIDGFRLVAERSGQYEGQTAPLWTADGVVWTEVWLSPNPPAAAKVGIYRRGFKEPIWAVATYSGYIPRDKQGDPQVSGQWETNPSNQLAKCAEMLGLRKAFPMELSGLYGTEEMDQAGAPRQQVRESAPAPAAAAPAEPAADAVLSDEQWVMWRDRVKEARLVEDVRTAWKDAKRAGLISRLVPGTDEALGDFLMKASAGLPESEEQAVDEPPVEAEVIESDGSAEDADAPMATTDWPVAAVGGEQS